MQLLDHLCTAYGTGFDITSVSGDLIEFLFELDFLRDRSCLFYLFKLCCLCATSVSPTYPDVTFGIVSTAGRQSRLSDVILPGQSYMANVRDSVASCSDDGNLAKFVDLASFFGRSVFAPDYDPWTYVDTFGRSKIYKSLLASYRVALSTPQNVPTRTAPGNTISVADASAVMRLLANCKLLLISCYIYCFRSFSTPVFIHLGRGFSAVPPLFKDTILRLVEKKKG